MRRSWWQRLVKGTFTLLGGRRSPAGRRPSWRPGFEALESRQLLSGTVGIYGVAPNRELRFDGDGTGNAVTLLHLPAQQQTILYGSTYANSQFDRIRINSGSGNDTVTVLGTPKTTYVNGISGVDRVTLRDTRLTGVPTFQGAVEVSCPNGFVTLDLDDSANPFARNVVLQEWNGTGTATGLFPTQVSYAYGTTGVRDVNLTTGQGADTVRVLSLGATTGVMLNSSGGADTVHVGYNDHVQFILGDLLVGNTTSLNTTLNISNRAHTGSRAATMDVVNGLARLIGLAPGTIRYRPAEVSAVSISTSTTGTVGSPFFFARTAGAPITLVSWGADHVNFGNGQNGVQGIQAPVTLGNASPATTVYVNNRADTDARSATLSTNRLSGLAPADINFGIGAINEIQVYTGAGGGTLTMQNLFTRTRVYGSTGDDAFILQGPLIVPLTLDGGPGTNVLVGPDAAGTWAITGPDAGTLGSVTFAQCGYLVGGSGNDVFAFGADGSLSLGLDGGGGRNRLDYSALTSDVVVNLALGRATGTAGVTGIQDVTGGAGNDLLVGDDQDNVLRGGGGRNLLIGGWGLDLLYGGTDEDLLIGGYTDFDQDETALAALLAEWANPDGDYYARVERLMTDDGTHPVLSADTVHDDAAGNELSGNGGLDWYFAGLADVLDGLEEGERVDYVF